jgi:hypothetical protein
LEKLKKAREAAVLKKKQMAEEKAKQEVIEEIQKEAEPIVEDVVDNEQDEEEVVLVQKQRPVKSRAPSTPSRDLKLTDELRSEIMETVRAALKPVETKEEKRKRKMEEYYQYMLEKQKPKQEEMKKPEEPVKTNASYKALFN